MMNESFSLEFEGIYYSNQTYISFIFWSLFSPSSSSSTSSPPPLSTLNCLNSTMINITPIKSLKVEFNKIEECGFYLICLSTNSMESWTKQELIMIQVIPPPPSSIDLFSISPQFIYSFQNSTSSSSSPSSLVFDLEGGNPSQLSIIAFVLQSSKSRSSSSTSSFNCEIPLPISSIIVNFISHNLTILNEFIEPGNYSICLSTDGGLSFVYQNQIFLIVSQGFYFSIFFFDYIFLFSSTFFNFLFFNSTNTNSNHNNNSD